MIYNRPRAAKKKRLTWYFNDKLDGSAYTFSANFKPAASLLLYDGIVKVNLGMNYTHDGEETPVYAFSMWLGASFRTVTFDEEPTGDLLAFLEANATPQ